MSAGTSLNCIIWIVTVLLGISVSFTKGGCEFKSSWKGRWFQSGAPNLLYINITHIETKGECYEEQGDKYLVFDKIEDCYRCMAIHEKHHSVLQYKETFCLNKASLQEICSGINGDAPLYSMFRKYPETQPIPCPFKSAPFIFSYNKGSGECVNPPSKAESCTDDSRLVLKYQACPDIPSTESNVEELICLATWKEGSTRYLMGRISQGNRRSLISDETQYRCFIYQRSIEDGKTVYNIAQSGDATCSGLENAFVGSKTMKFTTVDNHHNRCKFPIWITEHHTWLSLDHHKTYKFSQRNATLKILDDELIANNKLFNNHQQQQQQQQPNDNFANNNFDFQSFGFQSQDQRKQNNEMRVICHSILQSIEQKKVQIVAHVTAGCDSGYVCMVFFKRDTNVIEIQQSEDYVENPDEACANFNPTTTPFTTLITTTLHSKKCPHLGRYTTIRQHFTGTNNEKRRKRKRRQQSLDDGAILTNINKNNQQILSTNDCLSHDYEALAIGCTSDSHEMEFRSNCAAAQQLISSYSCHGSWEENGVNYVITSPMSRKSIDALRYCFIYTITPTINNNNNNNNNNNLILDGIISSSHQNQNKNIGPSILHLSSVTESCHRFIMPGINGNWAFNFTSNGTCAENEHDNSSSILVPPPTFLIVLFTLFAGLIIR